MHYLTIIGISAISIGTLLTYIGQEKSGNKDKEQLIETISSKDEKINSLTDEVKLLRENDERLKLERDQKIRTLSLRANRIFQEGNMFYAMFFAQTDKDVFSYLMESDFTKHSLEDKEIIENVTKAFMSVTLLESSTFAFDNNKKPYSNFDYAYIQISKMYSETDTILQHYGDIDHEIIAQLDEIRGRAKELLNLMRAIPSVEGGVKEVFGNGVPKQWAEFFAYFYLVNHKCELLCNKELHKQ